MLCATLTTYFLLFVLAIVPEPTNNLLESTNLLFLGL
jgi:hypothetical protein